MKRSLKLFQSWSWMCCLAPLALIAADHEPIDTEPVKSNFEGIEQTANCCSGGKNHLFDQYMGTYLPSSVHIIYEISAFGDEIRLEDGSSWKISTSDAAQALQWLNNNNPVCITQNTSWFSSYNFRIVNQVTGAFLAANLFQGPWKGGEKTQYVVEYDFQRGTVILSTPHETTHWEIHPSDLPRFREWNFSESIPIVIGQNADHNEWEALLINVRQSKCFVRAHQY